MGNKNSPEDVGLLSGEKKGEIGGMCSHTEGKIRGAERTGGENLRGFFFGKGRHEEHTIHHISYRWFQSGVKVSFPGKKHHFLLFIIWSDQLSFCIFRAVPQASVSSIGTQCTTAQKSP